MKRTHTRMQSFISSQRICNISSRLASFVQTHGQLSHSWKRYIEIQLLPSSHLNTLRVDQYFCFAQSSIPPIAPVNKTISIKLYKKNCSDYRLMYIQCHSISQKNTEHSGSNDISDQSIFALVMWNILMQLTITKFESFVCIDG